MEHDRREKKQLNFAEVICVFSGCCPGRVYAIAMYFGYTRKPRRSNDESLLSLFVLTLSHLFSGMTGEYRGDQLVGPGFKSVVNGPLKSGQKVYVTLNGREVCGVVDHHYKHHEQVNISVVGKHSVEIVSGSIISKRKNN